MEAFISNWVIRVKVNKCIWTSGLEWGWRSSATVFTKDRVLWKETISNLDRMTDQHLGLSYVCQLWTVPTLLKLSLWPQRYYGWRVEGKLIGSFLQTQRNQETGPPAYLWCCCQESSRDLWKGKNVSRDLLFNCFLEIMLCIAHNMLFQTGFSFPWEGIAEFCKH